jgi:HSP20 family protein
MSREQTANREQSQPVERRRGGGMWRRESQAGHLDAMLTPFRLMDTLINQMFGQESPLRTLGTFYPQVDIVERDGKLVVRADLPGVNVDNISVIEGKREDEREQEDTRTYRYERSYGQFRREIPLPEGADTESVNATFRNGVLEITFDMPEASRRQRQIPVQQEQPTAESGQPSQSAAAGQPGEQGAQQQQPAESGEQGESDLPEEKAA